MISPVQLRHSPVQYPCLSCDRPDGFKPKWCTQLHTQIPGGFTSSGVEKCVHHQLPAPLVRPSSPPLGNSCMPECSDYRGLKKQIRSIKLEQGVTLGPVIVIGNPDSSDEASDNEISTDKEMRDEGILGPVIVIGRDFQDTCTEASDCEGPRVKSSTDEDTLAPVIVIGQHPRQGISTEASNSETLRAKSDCRNRLAESFSTNGRVQTDIRFFPTSDITSDALANEGVNVVTTALGPRDERHDSLTAKPMEFDAGSPRQPSFRGTMFSHNSSMLPWFSDRANTPLPSLHQFLQQLSPVQQKFFKLLDKNLDKVDSFYQGREREMCERGNRLRKQLEELVAHRQRIYETPAATNSRFLTKKGRFTRAYLRKSTDLRAAKIPPEAGCGAPPTHGLAVFLSEKQTVESSKTAFDPREYQHAKKKLKKAVVECYRGLEVLNNYRVLNLVGFRKALKKFDKTTKLPSLAIYMSEKVDPAAFASGALVNDMLRELEELYAARFARGDRRIALNRLRLDASAKSHHMSTFRSGTYLGLALAAFATGIYQCSLEGTRNDLKSWKVLLYMYAILAMPVLLLLLIGVNINVWVRERINYPFIFVVWPLVWLGFVLVLLFNPISRFMSGSSRWWTIRNLAKLALSGVFSVDICSLTFTFDNTYFIACVYANYFPGIPASGPASSAYDEAWQICASSRSWGIHFVLSILPLLIVLCQAGKYFTGIVYSFFYHHWSYNGSKLPFQIDFSVVFKIYF
ncbi:hypothetical protein SCLCIDRAFT_6171 [Scleroderma citrinum Foug A]|uniref:SPX domain-containing protein n=1 Tax=Scleroderma citrinum Foug A TaxID=1036808 RepID=A0A0C3ERJ4_9AGAM|nr:hypothetical protein SCLCIDRAFT_6171 [Scleroderma citrinum Foug A]